MDKKQPLITSGLIVIAVILSSSITYGVVKSGSKATLAMVDTDLNKPKSDNQQLDTKYQKLVEDNQNLNTQISQLKEKLTLYRSDAGSTNKTIDTNTSVEDEYINNLLQVFDVNAKYYDSILDGSVPGITFKIKNNGTKTLKSIEVTVYFKDAKGNTIGEETYYPVNEYAIGGYKDLKPNYTFQMDDNQFYQAKTIPKDEWKTGSVDAKITKIEFEN